MESMNENRAELGAMNDSVLDHATALVQQYEGFLSDMEKSYPSRDDE